MTITFVISSSLCSGHRELGETILIVSVLFVTTLWNHAYLVSNTHH